MNVKNMTVNLTYSWTFTKKEWKEEKEFLEKIKDNPRIVLADNIHHAFYCMNDIVSPELVNMEVKESNYDVE